MQLDSTHWLVKLGFFETQYGYYQYMLSETAYIVVADFMILQGHGSITHVPDVFREKYRSSIPFLSIDEFLTEFFNLKTIYLHD